MEVSPSKAIRPCTVHDLEAIYEIINDAAQAYRGVIPPDRWHEPYMPREEIQLQIAAGVEFWGYQLEDELAGVMGVQQVDDVALIRHAYVRTMHRQRGIGSKLLHELVRTTYKPILIGTWADAGWAIRFYEKHGFRRVDAALTARLLKRYWDIPERQIEASVVLTDGKLPNA